MSARAAMYKRAADAIWRLRFAMDEHSASEWSVELDLIEFVIYSELSNILFDKVSTDTYINADSDTLHDILPVMIARVDLLYCDLMEVGEK